MGALIESPFGWYAIVRVYVDGVEREDVGFSPYEPKDGNMENLVHQHFDMSIKGAVSRWPETRPAVVRGTVR